MKVFESANLVLAFLLEVALLAAYGDGGFHLQGGAVVRTLIGIGAPALVVVLWSVLLAPNARHRLLLPWLLLLKIALFAVAVLVLVLLRQNGPALVLGALAVLNLGLAALWQQA